jgi:hypothetical protein
MVFNGVVFLVVFEKYELSLNHVVDVRDFTFFFAGFVKNSALSIQLA